MSDLRLLDADQPDGRAPAGVPALEWGRVIGLPVTVGTMGSVTEAVLALAGAGRPGYVCVANVHMLTIAHAEPDFRRVVEGAALVVSDGTPLVWQLRRRGYPHAEQVRGPDLMLNVCRVAAARGLPVYFYGGDETLVADLVQALRGRVPGLVVAGAEAAPVLPDRPGVEPAVQARIRRSGARIVFVALGCPKQEFWMRANSPGLDLVVLGVGQAFAIAAGHLREAPLWMRRRGLEWLFRLASEPRRLWRRYLVGNSLFLLLIWREAVARAIGRGPR